LIEDRKGWFATTPSALSATPNILAIAVLNKPVMAGLQAKPGS
jgi:hypothetical protein